MGRRRIIFIAGIALVFAVLVTVIWVLVAPRSNPASTAATQEPVASPKASLTPTATPTSTADPAAPAREPYPAPAPPAATCSDDVLVCVNLARADRGIAPLTVNGTLSKEAQSCAERMAASGQLTHSTSPPTGFSTWGENIAMGYRSAQSVFDGWMASDGHRANILNPSYTQMGIGHVASGSWWCQQFGA
jgi:uncharacterized protein YkwD